MHSTSVLAAQMLVCQNATSSHCRQKQRYPTPTYTKYTQIQTLTHKRVLKHPSNVTCSIFQYYILYILCILLQMLVVFKSAPILKRALKVKHAMMQLYILKLLKMQTKYLGRQWRKSNMKTMSAIYQKVRHRLNDDWAYGNGECFCFLIIKFVKFCPITSSDQMSVSTQRVVLAP